VLDERALARRVARENRGGGAIFDIAPAPDRDLDGHPRRSRFDIEAGDRDLRDMRTPHDEPGQVAGIVRMQEGVDGLGAGQGAQPAGVAIDGLGPGRHSPAGAHLEDVRGKAAVGQAEVKRRRAGVAGVVHVGQLCDVGPGRNGLRGLEQRLVAQRLLIGPLGGH
jgi:hypothetical protein